MFVGVEKEEESGKRDGGRRQTADGRRQTVGEEVMVGVSASGS